jgi:hypothetical protein
MCAVEFVEGEGCIATLDQWYPMRLNSIEFKRMVVTVTDWDAGAAG